MHEEVIKKISKQKRKNNSPIAIIITMIIFSLYGCGIAYLMGLYPIIIIWLFISGVTIYIIINYEDNNKKLIHAIKKGKIIIKETSITKFAPSIDIDNTDDSDENRIEGYYIISSDGENKYRSKLLKHSSIIGNDTLKGKKLNYSVGDKISVYIDPENPTNYFVNI